jgi:hypothetical protein
VHRSPLALAVPTIVLGLALGGVVVYQAVRLTDVATEGHYEILRINDREGAELEIRFESDMARVDGPCGSWVAPMQATPWLGRVSFGEFERRTWKTRYEVRWAADREAIQLAIRMTSDVLRAAQEAGDRYHRWQRQLRDLGIALAIHDELGPGECTARAQRVTDATLDAIATVRGWRIVNDEVVELDGGLVVRLLED